jgi:hypothetical protein
MTAAAVLEAARAVGVHVAVDGADLVLKSSNRPPSAVLDLIRSHKAEIIATITAATPSGQRAQRSVVNWRDRYEERAAIRQFDGGYTREEAERLAWSEIEDQWHLAHGERVPYDLCAGCRRSIGFAKALDLMDGNRAHHDIENACLIRHGERWRVAATRGLEALGMQAPRAVNSCAGN